LVGGFNEQFVEMNVTACDTAGAMAKQGSDGQFIVTQIAAALGQAVRSHERRYQAATAIVMAPD